MAIKVVHAGGISTVQLEDEDGGELLLSEVLERAGIVVIQGARVYGTGGNKLDPAEDPSIGDGSMVTVAGVKEAGMSVIKVLSGAGVLRYEYDETLDGAPTINEVFEEVGFTPATGQRVYLSGVKVDDFEQQIDGGSVLTVSGVKEAGMAIKVLSGAGVQRYEGGAATLDQVFAHIGFSPAQGQRVYVGGVKVDDHSQVIDDGSVVTVSGVKEAGAIKVLSGSGVLRHEGGAAKLSDIFAGLGFRVAAGQRVYVAGVKVDDFDQVIDDNTVVTVSGVKEAGC